MSLLVQLGRWLAGPPEVQPPPPPDPIGERVHAAIEASAHAKAASSGTYARRVQTMIDDLFDRMDRDARHQ